MTTTRVDVITPDEKEELRNKIKRQVEEYEKSGGVVTICPPRAYSTTDAPAARDYSIKREKSQK